MRAKPAARSVKKIIVVDDHPMIREGLRRTLDAEPDLAVCGEFENCTDAMEGIRTLKPDLVLMDISLPDKSGLELLKDIRAAFQRLPVLVLSMHDESLYAERALRAGASGYINKQQRPQTLVTAIRSVLAGDIHVSNQVSENILRRFAGRARNVNSPLETLTDREFEIFQLVGEGKSSTQIAKLLFLSPKTVGVHTANIRRKLKLATFADLIRYSVRREDERNLSRVPHTGGRPLQSS